MAAMLSSIPELKFLDQTLSYAWEQQIMVPQSKSVLVTTPYYILYELMIIRVTVWGYLF